MFQVWCIINN